MSNVGRVGVDSAGGVIVEALAPKVFIQGRNVAVVGASVQPHGNGSHSGAHMVTGSSKVFAQGKAICRVGDSASCGHTLSEGSDKVFSN